VRSTRSASASSSFCRAQPSRPNLRVAGALGEFAIPGSKLAEFCRIGVREVGMQGGPPPRRTYQTSGGRKLICFDLLTFIPTCGGSRIDLDQRRQVSCCAIGGARIGGALSRGRARAERHPRPGHQPGRARHPGRLGPLRGPRSGISDYSGSVGAWRRPCHTHLELLQSVEKGLRGFQIGRLEPFGESVVGRLKERQRLCRTPLIA
jgi:hypothetical protein